MIEQIKLALKYLRKRPFLFTVIGSFLGAGIFPTVYVVIVRVFNIPLIAVQNIVFMGVAFHVGITCGIVATQAILKHKVIILPPLFASTIAGYLALQVADFLPLPFNLLLFLLMGYAGGLAGLYGWRYVKQKTCTHLSFLRKQESQ
ncbi:hypothetical protein KC717_02730 [Candidatus Dojkabacteria bacterium]|uniref:Uncharacterized protein n=1 Tax=Candidatus Dojkabacteria bacterium TaxID=2099670 RepID=A0A955L7M5_9BACT|nr:hypothetical protein [Candidatus Dojkabacteria bacterium]